MKNIAVIGSGFAGLTSAIELASLGYQVTVFEKTVRLAVEQEILKQMALLSIWAQVGIGCQMFSKSFSINMIKK